MSKELKVVNTILIHAPLQKVWAAMTESEYTRKYMFNCSVETDWKVGSPVVWKMLHEGQEIIPVKGSVHAIDPGHSLTYTVIDPNVGMEDIPENYLYVTYELSEEGGATRLTVTQGGYEHASNGAARYQEAVDAGGWDSILAVIKELLEK